MPRRKSDFANNEYYHCYNRGVEKRIIFNDTQDFAYFIKSLKAFNTTEVFGKQRLYNKNIGDRLVEIVCSCLLPNHFHLVLKQNTENGISQFMQRIGISYSMYFNQKNERSGTLFQGSFKSKYLSTDQDLQQVISYVYHNNIVHNITDEKAFSHYIDHYSPVVRDRDSNFGLGVINIIKEKRLDLEQK